MLWSVLIPVSLLKFGGIFLRDERWLSIWSVASPPPQTKEECDGMQLAELQQVVVLSWEEHSGLRIERGQKQGVRMGIT